MGSHHHALSSSAHSSLPTSSPLELFTRWTFLVFKKHHTSREQSCTKRTKKHAYRSKQGTRKEIKRETQVRSYFYSMLSQRQRRPLAYKFILQIYSQHVYKCKYKDLHWITKLYSRMQHIFRKFTKKNQDTTVSVLFSQSEKRRFHWLFHSFLLPLKDSPTSFFKSNGSCMTLPADCH